MAIGSYTKTTYVNGSAPAINATNLNNAENQIKELSDAAVNGGASPTKIWTDANDGAGSGLDADTAKGSGVGGGKTGISDFNNVTGDGVFFRTSSTIANAPIAGSNYWVGIQLFFNSDASFAIQIAFRISTPSSIFIRTKTGGTWSAWSTIV